MNAAPPNEPSSNEDGNGSSQESKGKNTTKRRSWRIVWDWMKKIADVLKVFSQIFTTLFFLISIIFTIYNFGLVNAAFIVINRSISVMSGSNKLTPNIQNSTLEHTPILDSFQKAIVNECAGQGFSVEKCVCVSNTIKSTVGEKTYDLLVAVKDHPNDAAEARRIFREKYHINQLEAWAFYLSVSRNKGIAQTRNAAHEAAKQCGLDIYYPK